MIEKSKQMKSGTVRLNGSGLGLGSTDMTCYGMASYCFFSD